ncbi:MAG TPA: hypothetical protein VGQ50_05960 [Actinomycetota bacterium]|jgi:hypothetical protein|nr:hypothetical protein [Actinomycetota bacterium]
MSASSAVSDPEAPSEVVESDRSGGGRRVVGWLRTRGPRMRGLFAFLLYLVCSILMFALPVIGDLGNRCVGSCLPDTSLYEWSFNWMHQAISTGADPLFTDKIWAPAGVHLAWVTTLPGPALLFEPITGAFGGLFSVNILMILAPALAAWAAYLVCVRLTNKFWPAIVGGFVFGFSTYVAQHMRAQLNLVLIFFVPLAVYLVIRRVESSIGRILFVVLLALVLAGQFSSSTEVFATMTLFGAFAYLGALIVAPMIVKKRLLWTIPLLATSYAICGLLVLPILRRLQYDPPPDHAIRAPDINSMDLLSYVVPSQYGRFGGQQFLSLSEKFPVLQQNNTGYIGVLFLVVLVWFTVQFWRQWWAWLLTGFTLLVAILAMGPTLHIAGRSMGPLPGKWLFEAPLIQHATPDRFPLYMFMSLSILTAIWVAAASGRWAWVRYAIVAVGMVAISSNLAIEPTYHGTQTIPAFFTDGTYKQYINHDDVVLAIPYLLGGDMDWQSSTNFDFRLGRAYIGPIHPIGHNMAGLGMILTDPGLYLPPPNAVRFFIDERQVKEVVAQNPVPPEIIALMKDVLGVDGTEVGGVTVWEVPATGTTPHEPPPPSQVITTAPSG